METSRVKFRQGGVYAYTGTRFGMSAGQKSALRFILKYARPFKLVHGMAPGGDSEADAICKEIGVRTKGRPANPDSIKFVQPDEVHPEVKPPLERDYDIALEGVDGLIACPKDDQEVRRSGTWKTIRDARKIGRRVYRITRDGEIHFEEAPPKPEFKF